MIVYNKSYVEGKTKPKKPGKRTFISMLIQLLYNGLVIKYLVDYSHGMFIRRLLTFYRVVHFNKIMNFQGVINYENN